MADIKLIDAQGDERTYSGVAKVKIPLADGTGNATFIQPAGKKELTGTNEVDVTNFATAQVVDKNLIAENIKSGVSILGVEGTHEGGGSGECSGNHVIDVDNLPETGEEGAVYKKMSFVDVVANMGEWVKVVNDWFIPFGASCGCYIIPTKTTEGIMTSDYETCFYFYYITDENDIFIYDGSSWASASNFFDMPYGGIINDISEATDDTCYYALMEGGLYQYSNGEWASYIKPSGSLEITEFGEHDVSKYATATVKFSVPMSYIVQSVADLPTDAVNNSLAIVMGVSK